MQFVSKLFGVVWVLLRRVRELMSWGGQVGCRNILTVWQLAHYV
jgi:hypothetical protein